MKRQKKNGLVFGMNSKRGFTILELLIVILIMGIIGSVVMPNLKRTTPRYEREAFLARLNALTQLAWQQALIEHKIVQVLIDVSKKRVSLLIDTQEPDRSGDLTFKPLIGLVQETEIIIPDQIEFKQVIIEGFDMMAKFTRAKTEEMWFYVIPEGLTQDVIINCIDVKDTKNDEPRSIGLVLNPFNAQFKIYDTFQKP